MSQGEPRQADLLFLKLAVKNRLLADDAARDVLREVESRAAAGTPTKARLICVERGLLDRQTSRDLKHLVRSYLETKASTGGDLESTPATPATATKSSGAKSSGAKGSTARTEKTDRSSDSSLSRRTLGNYKVLERLGSGAMGVVYKARHVNLNKTIALKVLQDRLAGDESYLKRFLLEARAAAALNHPSIVQAYDVGEQDGVYYLAMEFVDGETVKEIVERDGRLDEKRAVKIALHVTEALEHASKQQIIHRDVKPANIMLGSDGRAKLLDLGLAKRVEGHADFAAEASLTQVGRAIGTPYYMSPEQGLDGALDHRTDIYSLGATLFYMVTGEVPFKGPTPQAVIAKHIHEDAPDPRSRVKSVSSGLSNIVLKMLAKDPKDRYQDHADLTSDLEAVLSGSDVKSAKKTRGRSTSSTGERSGRSERGPSLVTVLSTFAVAAGVVAAVVLGGTRPTTTSTDLASNNNTNIGGATPAATPGSTRVETAEAAAPTAPAKDESSSDIRERRASERLAQLEKQGLKGWELHDANDDVVRCFPGTKAAQRAALAVRELSESLGAAEEAEVAKLAETVAELGEPTIAVAQLTDASERVRSERARTLAKTRAGEIESKLERKADELETHAAALAGEGKEAEAALALKQAASLRKDATRKAEAIRRADDLVKAGEAKLARVKDDAAQAQRSRYAALCETVRDRIRARAFTQGASDADAAAAQLEEAALKVKASSHANALRALATLDELVLQAFAKAKGEKLEVILKQSQPLRGKVTGVVGGKLSIEVRAGVERAIALNEIDDRTFARELRRVFGNDERVTLGLALSALYRGDAIAAAKLEDGARWLALAADIEPTEVASKPESDDKPRPAAVSPRGRESARAESKGAEPASTPKVEKAEDAQDLERLVYDKRSKIFEDADNVGWAGRRPVASYDFLGAARELTGHDWKTLEGRPYRAPRGSAERAGLVLDGDFGRASFEIPLQGAVRVKIQFTSQMSLRRDSRLALTFEDPKKGVRIESLMGVLSEPAKGKKAERQGNVEDADWASRVTPRAQHTFEVSIEDGVAVSKLDGRVVSRLDNVGLGDNVRVGLEWAKIAANLHTIEVEAMPEKNYALSALTAGPSSGRTSKVAPAKTK